MDIGKLRKRIVIEAPTRSRDEYGQDIPVWTTIATVWGSIMPLHGQQLALARASTITATASDLIKIRYRPGLKIGFHRIRFGGSADGFDQLTEADYLNLSEANYDILAESAAGSTPRYYSINDINDPEERHNELWITVTEDKG